MTAFCGWCGHAAEYQTKQDDQTNTVVKEIVIALPSLLLKSLPGVYQGESVTACFSLFSQRLLHCLTFHEAIFWVVVLDSGRRGCVKAGFSLFKARRPQSWCVEIVQRCRPMTLYEPTTSQKNPQEKHLQFSLLSLHHNTHGSWSVVLVDQEQLSDHFHFIFGSGGGGRGLLEPVPAVPGQR